MHYYAHSIENEPPEAWQPLEEHLKNVGIMTAAFAGFFNAAAWGKTAGEFHDLGKGSTQWQAYLRRANGIFDEFSKNYEGHVNHAIHGARNLFSHSKDAGKILSYCIAGHHGGLPNWFGEAGKGLNEKLKETGPEINFPCKEPAFEQSIPFKIPEPKRFGFQLQFFVRMIFSCLVDADYLDTEAALDKKKAEWRSAYPALDTLYDRFWSAFNILRKDVPLTEVNRQREKVLENCLAAAGKPPGLFSLTVPTGGGKTLSSLAFALEHAHKFNKRRIIYVIPFTTIIEQNAAVFRQVLGDDAVLEHHCNFIPEEADWRSRLAAENWDAPVVVTTNIQFFDSFFAHKPGVCRKLHNVSESIVIFDEVQTIPVEKLKPCLEVLKELTLNYGVSAVLCTATQPAFDYSEEFQSGLKNVTEVVSDVPSLFTALTRTRQTFIGEISHSDLIEKLCDHPQALCIVNTRKQASEIFDLLPEDSGNFHLSALMYPAHRSRILNEIRSRIAKGLPCRVISTQLIEAGVDIDFPVVYRTAAGMDAIAQAAGRCNREGKISTGEVFIFKLENGTPPGFFRQTAQCAEALFEKFSGKFLEPECIREYFLNYYWINEDRMDEKGIFQKCLHNGKAEIQFRDIAAFHMIETITTPIILALEDDAVSLVNQLPFVEKKGAILRKLQRFSVQIYEYDYHAIKDWIENPVPGVFILRTPELYSNNTGLKTKSPEGQAFFA